MPVMLNHIAKRSLMTRKLRKPHLTNVHLIDSLVSFRGADKDEVTRLLTDLDVPTRVRGILNVALNMRDLHSLALTYSNDLADQLEPYQSLAEMIISSLDPNAWRAVEIDSSAGLHGDMDSHPLYTLFSVTCADSLRLKYFNCLRLAVCSLALPPQTIMPAVRLRLCRTVRLLGDATNREELAHLNQVLTDPEETLFWIWSTFDRASKHPIHFYELGLALELALNTRLPRRQRHRGSKRNDSTGPGGIWILRLTNDMTPDAQYFLSSMGETRFYPREWIGDESRPEPDFDAAPHHALIDGVLSDAVDDTRLENAPVNDVRLSYQDRTLRLPLGATTLTPYSLQCVLNSLLKR